jgi:hypothetical protein
MALEDMNMEPEEHDEETPHAEESGIFIIVAGAMGRSSPGHCVPGSLRWIAHAR